MGDRERDEPLTQLQEAAAQMHELLIAYCQAGFSRKEAMELVREVLRSSMHPRQGA